MSDRPELDVVIVGAGFAGMYMLHRARGIGLSARVFEAGDGVGGTWYWNRYPGRRCDVESMEYSYQFSEELQQEWEWTERYATQPEILDYANHVADRFDLRRDIQFETRVRSATYDDAADRWTIRTDHGERAVGAVPRHGDRLPFVGEHPRLPGPRHASRARRTTPGGGRTRVSTSPGKRVGVIGTGSSAIQSIPIIAAPGEPSSSCSSAPRAIRCRRDNGPLDARRSARSRPTTPGSARATRSDADRDRVAPPGDRERPRSRSRPTSASRCTRSAGSTAACRSSARSSICSSIANANETAAEFVRAKIREIVKDPAVADRLSPKTVIGCKRLCVDTGYFETFNRDNVELVDVSETPIDEITPHGLRVGGRDFEFDCIVFATGFDAMTGALLSIDIRGRDGRSLRDAWADGPRTYLGLGVAGFPNLFTISGPGQPVGAHQHDRVDRAARELDHRLHRLPARQRPSLASRRRPRPRTRGSTYVNTVADFTLFPSCNSWYLGANVPGKPRVFMPLLGFPAVRREVQRRRREGLRGVRARVASDDLAGVAVGELGIRREGQRLVPVRDGRDVVLELQVAAAACANRAPAW